MTDLEVYIELEHPDVILITESWLREDISNEEIKLHGYNLLRKDRTGAGGPAGASAGIWRYSARRIGQRT